MILALLLPLALAQHAAGLDPVPDLRFGHLRHVQWLEPRDGVVRFATQVEIGTMQQRWPKGSDSAVCVFEGRPLSKGEVQTPVAELAVGTSMIRPFTWTRRPTWFLFELEGATRLAALEPRRNASKGLDVGCVLRIFDYPAGEELLAIADVQELEDAFVYDGQGELVARSGSRLLWSRLSKSGDVVGRELLELGLDAVCGATFARGEVTPALPGWCIGLRDGDLVVVPFSLAGVHAEDAFAVTLDGGREFDRVGPGTSIRLTAWATPTSTHLALGWPGYRSGVGKLAVFDLSGAAALDLWEGRPDPEVDGDTLDQCDYGQALAFIPDADEDGVPDLLVCGPWSFVSRLHLLSGRSGKIIERWTPQPSASAGHWLSLSADGTRAIVGGADQRGYPENLRFPGHAYLLELPRLKALATWVFRPREH